MWIVENGAEWRRMFAHVIFPFLLHNKQTRSEADQNIDTRSIWT